MNISLRQIRAFVEVAESGSFTQAANRLHLTQSALSGLIKELEQHLAVRLFDRTTRKLALSGAGLQLLPLAERILNEVFALGDEASKLKDGQLGNVRVAITQQLAASFIPYFLAEFLNRYPNIQVYLSDCSVEQVIKQVQNAEVDFGIGPDRRLPTDIKATQWFSLPFYAVLPNQHALARQEAVCWKDLLCEPLICLTGSFNNHLAMELPTELAKQVSTPTYQVNFLSTALGMVRNGMGLSLCLPYAGDWVKQHKLVMRPLIEPEIQRRFFFYHRKNRSLSTAAELFEQYLRSLPNTTFYR